MPQFFYSPGLLRLVLAMIVFLTQSVTLPPSVRIMLGSFAVRVFFILSGFWIAEMWQTQYRYTRQSYLTFTVSRYWRIAPLYFLCFGMAVLISFRFSQHWPEVQACLRDPLALVQVHLFICRSALTKILVPAWTLSLEFEFYLLAPIIVSLLNLGKTTRLYSVAILVALFSFAVFMHDWAYITLLAYFIPGVASQHYQWRPSRLLANLSLALFIGTLSLSVVYRATFPPSHYVAWFVTLILPFAIHTVRQPSPALDRFFGGFSYTIYLFHWVAVMVVSHVLHRLHGPLTIVATWVLAVGGSLAIYFFYEAPLELRRKAFVKGRKAAVARAGEKFALN